MIRHIFESLGLVSPRPARIEEVRASAMKINDEARKEIHDSREKRNILNLEYELTQRRRLKQ